MKFSLISRIILVVFILFLFELQGCSVLSYSKQQKKQDFKVLLTLHNGEKCKGTIRSIRNEGVELEEQFFKKNDIAIIRVQRPMKMLRGAKIGFIIGAGIGTAAWLYLITIPDMGSNINDLIIMSCLGGSFIGAPGALLGAASGLDDYYELTGNDADKQWEFFKKRYARHTKD